MCGVDESFFPAKKIAMATKTASEKVECLNPNTGGRMNIDKAIYDLFSKAIYHSLKAGKELTYLQIVEGIYNCFKKQKTKFGGSVGWYAVTVKNDMEARGIIEAVTIKGKKLNRLKK
jgi:hypothetical protein